jgi:hypothetical protein
MENKEKQLAERLEELTNSLRNGWIPFNGILGNLLIELESQGYLKKDKESYVKILK